MDLAPGVGEGVHHQRSPELRLKSVNVSQPKAVVHEGAVVSTGIFKEPVIGRVRVHRLGLEGDGQADLKVHGGPDQAVYAYPAEHYDYWRRALGRKRLPWGQFGENLTIEGLEEGTALVGDILRIGGALLQVTHPRLPCYKLGIRMGAGKDFPKRCLRSGRGGFSLRVIEEGELAAGDPIALAERAEDSLSIAEFLQIYVSKPPDPSALVRALSAPGLSAGWRSHFEKALERA